MVDSVRVERQGPVTTVILDRPQARNAVDPATAAALAAAFLAIERDETVRVSVLWGTGGTFCAGADLKAVAAGWDPSRLVAPTGEAHDPHGPMGPTRLSLEKPVIAAIAGHAVAGGLELALWCDLRVMEDDAVLGVFCRRWGVPLVDGGTVRLPRIVGHGRALEDRGVPSGLPAGRPALGARAVGTRRGAGARRRVRPRARRARERRVGRRRGALRGRRGTGRKAGLTKLRPAARLPAAADPDRRLRYRLVYSARQPPMHRDPR